VKKRTACIFLFLTIFFATYLLICFAVPGFKIKLAAHPVEYFLKSIGHMVFIKFTMSSVLAFTALAAVLLIRKIKR